MLMGQNQKVFGPPSSQAYYIWQWLVPKNIVLGLKIGWDHFHYMMHQGLASWSLLKLDMLVFQLLWLGISNRENMCYMWSTLLWTLTINMTWFSTIQIKMFVRQRCFSCSVRGLNLVLSICKGLSFGEVAKGWVNVVGGKLLCVVDGAKLLCVCNVGLWCLSC
jgi:hypothetical protein